MQSLNVDSIREIILDILVKIDSNQGYINILVNHALKKNKIGKRDAEAKKKQALDQLHSAGQVQKRPTAQVPAQVNQSPGLPKK